MQIAGAKMKVEKIRASSDSPLERVYFASAVMNGFRGRDNIELQLFRVGATEAELDALRGKNLVGPADPNMPPQALAGASEDAALECMLEAFTEEEADQLAAYLQERYSDQFGTLAICPMDVPVPLGIGPLAKIPESENSGFINFDLAPDYPLDFKFRGYFDLQAQN